MKNKAWIKELKNVLVVLVYKVVKIDVQGYEYKDLKGMEEIIELYFPLIIVEKNEKNFTRC